MVRSTGLLILLLRAARSFTSSTISKRLDSSLLAVQVLSDVDDTLKSSGGLRALGVPLGGIDIQYERGQYYPGVAEFMLQLSLFGSPSAAPAKVAILTARAEEFKFALEIKDSSSLAGAFTSAAKRSNVDGWGLGPVLYGSVAEWICQERKGLRKFTNFEKLRNDRLEYIYVGDTGEKDEEAGEALLREYPEAVRAVFLHVVSETENYLIPSPKFIQGRPMVYFRTYVGAAVAAVSLSLLDAEGLSAVVTTAERELGAMNSDKSSSQWVELQYDIDRAQRLLETL